MIRSKYDFWQQAVKDVFITKSLDLTLQSLKQITDSESHFKGEYLHIRDNHLKYQAFIEELITVSTKHYKGQGYTDEYVYDIYGKGLSMNRGELDKFYTILKKHDDIPYSRAWDGDKETIVKMYDYELESLDSRRKYSLEDLL